MANQFVRINERQQPIMNFGYHHEWSPNVHTLMLASYIDDRLSLVNPVHPSLLVFSPGGELSAVQGLTFDENFFSTIRIYSGEVQQLWQQGSHSTIVGGR